MYQVLVDYYNAPLWRSAATDNQGRAHSTYAAECGRLHRGGIRTVYLTKHGVVVAQSNHNNHQQEK